MKTLAYVNPECYLDVDISILKHLAKAFKVIWFPVYYTDRPIYYTPEQIDEYARENGIELHLCPRKHRQRHPGNLSFYRQIVREINERDVDIVYSCITEEFYWLLASFCLKPRLILGLHDVIMHPVSGFSFSRLVQIIIREISIRRAPNVCVFSKGQAVLFKQRYGREAARLALACRNLGPGNSICPNIDGGVKLLFFGYIGEYKGVDLLISALEGLREEGKNNMMLTIAGRGDYWPICEALIKTPSMYDLKIRFIQNEEIPDLLASHHFVVLPYRSATQSGPLALAAGYGIPVVAPDFGCFKEYYDEGSAILYTSLEDALRQVSELSPSQYAALKSGADDLKGRVSEEAVANLYISYFRNF